ncbi:hypothetical protein GWK47_044038 [Chionoecetes opilio]|uniref:Uncharacterized protein n=1 Tax=Chionoecetes opilio TaxID=41210 RepID=A0A8J5CVM1_CHIOP|nr:hypothetical protein GWK47_044038 [Chionoecetes opilio]
MGVASAGARTAMARSGGQCSFPACQTAPNLEPLTPGLRTRILNPAVGAGIAQALSWRLRHPGQYLVRLDGEWAHHHQEPAPPAPSPHAF